MPFHVSGRKPRVREHDQPVPLWPRFLIGAFGATLVVWGSDELRKGRLFGLNWLRQPIYSTSVIVLGDAFVVLAVVPWSWLDQLAKRSASRPTKGHPPAPCTGSPASPTPAAGTPRSEEHTSELQSLACISYAVFCLKKKKTPT
jgi:hypothetical protein